jgi:broad specificity phosphatase PhoE
VLFVRQATTPDTRAACFPADAAADPASLARAASIAGAIPGAVAAATVPAGGPSAGRGAAPGAAPGVGSADTAGARSGAAWVAPARAARQTAVALGLAPLVAVELGEADSGRWRGLPYARVAGDEPEALAAWLADPDAAPHGGESQSELAARVARWLDSVRGQPDGVAVCDVGAIRAALGHALGLDPTRAACFDLAPLSTTELTATGGGWRVAHVNRVAHLGAANVDRKATS